MSFCEQTHGLAPLTAVTSSYRSSSTESLFLSLSSFLKQVEVPAFARFGSEHGLPRGEIVAGPVSRLVEISWSLWRKVCSTFRLTSIMLSAGSVHVFRVRGHIPAIVFCVNLWQTSVHHGCVRDEYRATDGGNATRGLLIENLVWITVPVSPWMRRF